MADDLHTIVQRMIDAGEPEENIATVVKHYQSVSAPSAADLLTGTVGRDTNLSDAQTAPDWKANLNGAMQSSAHPQTVTEMGGLLLPGQVEGAIRTMGMYGRALKQGLQDRPAGVSGLLSVPSRAYQKLKGSLPSEMTKAVEDFRGAPTPAVAPETPRITTGGSDLWDKSFQEARTARSLKAPTGIAARAEDVSLGRTGAGETPTLDIQAPSRTESSFDPVGEMLKSRGQQAPTPMVPSGGLSAIDRAELVKKGFPPDVIAKIEAQAAQPAPMASHAPTQPELQGPRIRTGAERVGRDVGMTKEEVRQATGPVLDEAAGQASPILPEKSLQSIIDKMKSLPPGGPEREAYVAAATSGKTKWQVENIRRTLEHLGLVVPAAVGGREALLQLMRSHQPTSETP